MNEKIKELYLQARHEAWNDPIDIENCAVEDIKGFSQQVYEKFAELIVRECHDVIVVGGVDNLDIVLEHFGVE